MAQRARKGKTDEATTYEALLQRLEEAVARLEDGELSLEEALTAYQEGVALAAQCQKLLDTAEQRIEELRIAEEPD